MTLTSTITKQTIQGDRKVVYGTFANDGTGGNIDTGLQVVENFQIQHTSNAVVADAPVVNETFPLTGHTPVTIVTTSAKPGIWRAEGY